MATGSRPTRPDSDSSGSLLRSAGSAFETKTMGFSTDTDGAAPRVPAGATPAADLEARHAEERRRLEEFAQEQFRLLREARDALLREKKASEQAIEARTIELDRRAQALQARERELSEQLEDAISERHDLPTARYSGSKFGPDEEEDWPDLDGIPSVAENKALRDRLKEVGEENQQLRMERDYARNRVDQLQQAQLELQGAQAERQMLTAERDKLAAELNRLKEQQTQSEALLRVTPRPDPRGSGRLPVLPSIQPGLDRGLDGLLPGREDVGGKLESRQRPVGGEFDPQLLLAERDAAREDLRHLRQRLREAEAARDQPRPEDEDTIRQLKVERDTAVIEAKKLRGQLAYLDTLRAEHDAALNQIEALRQHELDLELQVSELRAQVDAVRANKAPDEWAGQELEFAEMQRRLQEDRRRLDDDTRELQRRESEWQRKVENAKQDLDEIEAARRAAEAEQTRLEEYDRELQLREAEIIELKEMAERDLSRERSEIAEERRHIARLREGLRIDQMNAKKQAAKSLKPQPPAAPPAE